MNRVKPLLLSQMVGVSRTFIIHVETNAVQVNERFLVIVMKIQDQRKSKSLQEQILENVLIDPRAVKAMSKKPASKK